MVELGRYVRQERVRRGLTQEQVGQAVGVAHSYVSKIEGGRGGDLGAEIKRNLAALLATSAEHLDALLYDRPPPRAVSAGPLLPQAIPIMGYASAGPGGGSVDDWVYLPPLEARGRSVRAFRVTGECMQPEINPGDVVIVDHDAQPRDGDLVLVWHEDQQLVKRFYRRNSHVELRPNVGEPITLASQDARIQGVVFGVHKRYGRPGGGR